MHHLKKIWSQYAVDPVGFTARFWPQISLAPYQAQILNSLVHNSETWVHSGNELGKSFLAALAAVWWFATRKAKVVTTSTSEQQLVHVLWAEIGHLLSVANVDGRPFSFGFHRSQLRLSLPGRAPRDSRPSKYYLLGQVTAQVESFQGHHLPTDEDGTPSVLFIFDEASGLEREFYEAATTQAHRILAIGNPLRCDGVFYEKCRAGDQRHPDGSDRMFRKVFHVSGDDSPNVAYAKQHLAQGREGRPPTIVPGVLSYEQYLERLATWPAEKQRTRLFGLFPDEADERLFPPEWLDIAQQLGAKLQEYRQRPGIKPRFDAPYAMGIDVAAGGADQTVWVVLGRFGVCEIVAKKTPNTSQIAGQTVRLRRKYRIRTHAIAIDAGGGGKQIADLLRDRRGYELCDVSFGAASEAPKEYSNRRAELYGELRKQFEPKARIERLLALPVDQWLRKGRCLSLPPADGALREELGVLPRWYDSEGRVRLPVKSRSGGRGRGDEPTLREMLGRSPDRADALVLAWSAWRWMMKVRERTHEFLRNMGVNPHIRPKR